MFNFKSDYTYGANPKIMDTIVNAQANSDNNPYDNDVYHDKLSELLQTYGFNSFRTIPTGTGANVFALNAIVSKVGSIMCSSMAHIYTSENSGPFSWGAQPIVLVADENAKIYPSQVENTILENSENFIHPRLEVLSLTQPTEKGAVYTIDELREFRKLADKYNFKIHIDGARIFNALEYLNIGFKQMQDIIKADAFFIGGGKAGCLFGELVAFKDIEVDYARRVQKKLGLQVAKSWIISASFLTLLDEGENIWRNEAENKRETIQLLIETLKGNDQFKLSIQDSYTNILYIETSFEWKEKIESICGVSTYLKPNGNYSIRFVSNPYSNFSESTKIELINLLKRQK